ncbi:hypothetical protein NEIELOOT_02126 [Neisseria elongata subsp. glycolytica ATCC 29315]|uniref:Uncharacterized protein n=1 Tax=Neisseria elongata subsp. glycolytica ATCC 29315 TaxID=546263 RepID=D4DSS9_NEIEG|nr:hypothetical protein NEIELOOT_02126 [Neisseria elongata subsp. glycolytica ATCC 29315]
MCGSLYLSGQWRGFTPIYRFVKRETAIKCRLSTLTKIIADVVRKFHLSCLTR